MVVVYSEVVKSDFEGTIIDIETIGDFCREHRDSREYHKLLPLIFGYIDRNGLKIYYSKKIEPTRNFKDTVARTIPNLNTPLYAFQCCFERGVLYHSLGITISIDGELNKDKREWKGDAVASLGIENYDDPFSDIGRKCKEELEKGNTEPCIKHNRSCLLKERDILLKRGFRTPDGLELFDDKT